MHSRRFISLVCSMFSSASGNHIELEIYLGVTFGVSKSIATTCEGKFSAIHMEMTTETSNSPFLLSNRVALLQHSDSPPLSSMIFVNVLSPP